MTTPISDLMRTIQIKMINRGEAWSRELPLTITQSRTIGWIDYIEETEHRGVIQRELAEMSGTSAASISSLIDGLEKSGYVERRPSPDDARRKEIYVLPKAKGFTDGFQRLMEQTEKDLLAPLSPAEQKALLELLTKINQNLDPDLPMRRPQN
jgi:MarR family transcriptional regulator, repressor for mepA